MSKQRTRKFVTKIFRKTCLRKIGTQNRHKKLQFFFSKNKCKGANIGSSTFQLHGVDLIDMQLMNLGEMGLFQII